MAISVERMNTDAAGFPQQDGQLTGEFRRWILSGAQVPTRLALADLIDGIGAPVWVCGPTAAALHTFDGFTLKQPFHVLTPATRNVRRLGAVVHSSERIGSLDCELLEGLPVTSPTRTLIDIATTSSLRTLTAALDGALRDGLMVERFLHERIADLRSSGRYGIPRLLDAIEGADITRGAHSWLEREYLRLIAAAGLPRPIAQQIVGSRGNRLIRVDFRFPGTNLVVEVLGYRWHRTTAQMSQDAERMNRMLLDGLAPVQFTYVQLTTTPEQVVATTVEALAYARRTAA